MRKIHGFTLMELLVTLMVAAILTTMAVPSFRGLLLNNRLTTAANDFSTAVNLARSESARRDVVVRLTAVTPSDAGNEWGKGGWRLWVDANGNDAYDSGEELYVVEALKGKVTLDSTGDITEFQFSPSGMVNQTDTLMICDDRTGETGRQLDINAIGRLSVTRVPCS